MAPVSLAMNTISQARLGILPKDPVNTQSIPFANLRLVFLTLREGPVNLLDVARETLQFLYNDLNNKSREQPKLVIEPNLKHKLLSF